MKKSSAQMVDILAQGWTTLFIIFVANIVLDLSRCSVQGDCAAWSQHLGVIGVTMVTVISGLYAAMPMLIRTFTHPAFRVAVVALTIFIALFYLAHEATHLRAGDKPFGIFHTLDILHHVIAIWLIVVSVKWARNNS